MVKTHPDISIILCNYNGEPFLEECLDSIFAQTFDDFELICVNDGSTDHSIDILLHYFNKYRNKIKLIDQSNVGLATSRNIALDKAEGNFIIFVDSDDKINENTCKIISETMHKNNLDMLSYSGYNFQESDNKFAENKYWSFNYLPKKFDCVAFTLDECQNFVHKMAVSSCLTAYRLSFIRDCKLKFPDGLFFEDNLFFHKGILNSRRSGIIKDKLYYRRIHPESITQNFSLHFSSYMKIIDLLMQEISKANVPIFVFRNYNKFYINALVNRYKNIERCERIEYKSQLLKILMKWGGEYKRNKSGLLANVYKIYLCAKILV